MFSLLVIVSVCCVPCFWWAACSCCNAILSLWWNGGSKPYPHTPGQLVYFPESQPTNFLTSGGAFDVNDNEADGTVAVAGVGVFPALGLVPNDETTPIPAKFAFPTLHTINPTDYGGVFTDEVRSCVAVAANSQGGYFCGCIRQYSTRTATDFNGNGAAVSIAVTRIQAGSSPAQLVIPIDTYPWAGVWAILWADPEEETAVSTATIPWNATAAQVQTAIQAIPGASEVTVASSGTFPNLTYTLTFPSGASDSYSLVTVINNTSLFGSATVNGLSFAVTGDGGDNVSQQIQVTAAADPRNYTLTWIDPKGNTFVTPNLPYNATQSQVQSAIQAWLPLQNATVSSVGTNPFYAHTVTFTGFAGKIQTGSGSNTFNPITVTVHPVVGPGSPGWSSPIPPNSMIVSYNMQLTIGGSPPPTGGTYGIPFGDAISNSTNTATVAYNASASDLQSALNALTGLTTSVTAYGEPPNCTFIIAVSGVSWESGFGMVVNSLTPSGTITMSSCPVSQFEQQQVVVSGSPAAAYVPVNGGNIIWTANWTNSYPETESATDGDTVALSLANTQCVFTAVSIAGRIVLPGSGNYTLSWTDPYGFPHSASIAVSGGASAVQTALEAFPGLSGNVTATVSGTLLTLTLSGSAAGVFVVPSNGASLYGGIQTQFTGPLTSIVTFTGIPGPIQLITGMDQTGLVSTTSPYLVMWDIMQVPDSTDEVQQIVITGTPTDGTYTITWENPAGASYTTIALEYDASSGTVEAALQALFSIGAVTVDTTGESPNYTHKVRFRDFNGPMPSLMTVQNSTTGGTFTVTRITTGVAAVAPSIVATFNPWANPRMRSDLIGQLTAFGALCTSNFVPEFFWPHGGLVAPQSYASETVNLQVSVADAASWFPESTLNATFQAKWTDPKGFTFLSAPALVDITAATLQTLLQSLTSELSGLAVSQLTQAYSATYIANFSMSGGFSGISWSTGTSRGYLLQATVTLPTAASGGTATATVVFTYPGVATPGTQNGLTVSVQISGDTAYVEESEVTSGTVVFGLVYYSDISALVTGKASFFSSPVALDGSASDFEGAFNEITSGVTVTENASFTPPTNWTIGEAASYKLAFPVQFAPNPIIFTNIAYPGSIISGSSVNATATTGAVVQLPAELPNAVAGYLKLNGTQLVDLPAGATQSITITGGGASFTPTGTYVLQANGPDGTVHATTSLVWNAAATAVQSAVRALPGLSAATVTQTLNTVTGTSVSLAYLVSFNQPAYSQLTTVVNSTCSVPTKFTISSAATFNTDVADYTLTIVDGNGNSYTTGPISHHDGPSVVQGAIQSLGSEFAAVTATGTAAGNGWSITVTLNDVINPAQVTLNDNPVNAFAENTTGIKPDVEWQTVVSGSGFSSANVGTYTLAFADGSDFPYLTGPISHLADVATVRAAIGAATIQPPFSGGGPPNVTGLTILGVETAGTENGVPFDDWDFGQTGGYSFLVVDSQVNDGASATITPGSQLSISAGIGGGDVFPWYDCLPSDTLVAGGSPGLLTDSGGGPVVTAKSAVTLGTLGCIGDDGAIYVSGTATSNKTPPVQVVTIMLAPISGTLTLSWVSPSSGTIIIGPLGYDASASDIQTAMPSGFTVIQRPNTSPNAIFVVFFNGYQGQTVNAMTVSNNGTSNGTAYSTVVTKTNPYADCIQNITISGPPTSGTYTISWVDPLGNTRTTGSIPYNSTASQVQTIVQATTGMSTVTVGLSASTPNVILQVTFVGLGGPLNLMTIANSTSGGTFAVSYLIFGNWDQQQIAFTGECVNPGGTFTISWKNASNQTFTTTALPWNATQAQIQTALRLLSGLASLTALGSLTVTTPSSLANIYGESVPVTTVKAISGDVELDMIGVPGPVNSVSINNSTTGQALIAVAGNAFTAALLRIDQSLNVIWAAPTQYPVIGLVIQPGDSTLFVLEDFSTYGAAPANNGNNVFIDSYNAATGALLAPRTTTRIQFTQDTETGAGVASVPVPVESASGRNALVS